MLTTTVEALPQLTGVGRVAGTFVWLVIVIFLVWCMLLPSEEDDY